jgi:hypothetical protein
MILDKDDAPNVVKMTANHRAITIYLDDYLLAEMHVDGPIDAHMIQASLKNQEKLIELLKAKGLNYRIENE